jgi:hypothetical protein
VVCLRLTGDDALNTSSRLPADLFVRDGQVRVFLLDERRVADVYVGSDDEGYLLFRGPDGRELTQHLKAHASRAKAAIEHDRRA